MNEPNWEEIAKDKEVKKQAVLDYIISKCTCESEFEDLRAIGACLAIGGKLSLSILTGGLANYTYKVSVTHCEDCDDRYLFAKLSFPYAMLFPDKPCPLSRTENEYKMMQTFNDLSPGCVATPYFCDDVGDDMKLLVTQWSPIDEQFGNQFIDGTVDVRCAEKLSRGIAALHCSEVDHTFNEKMRPWFHSLTPILSSIIDGLFNPEGNQDRVSTLGQELGRDVTNAMFEHYNKTVDASECLIHGDMHVFNILVDAKPSSIEALENSNSAGDVVLCDFEMSHAGVAGHDIGPLQAFPISCIYAHSINGDHRAALDILNWLDIMWDEYEKAMRKAGTTDEQINKIFRDMLQFSALYLLSYYGLNVHMEFLPIDEGNVEDLTKVKEAVGVTGLRFFNWGIGTDDLSLGELKANFKRTIKVEMGQLLNIKKTKRNRRSSLLRTSGRRVSDANLHFVKMGRLSFVSADGGLEGHDRHDAVDLVGKRKTLPCNIKLELDKRVEATPQ